MGCGESKHALATENTLTKSKSKNNPPVEKAVSDGNVNATEGKNLGNGNVEETGGISGVIKEEKAQPDAEGKANSEETDGKEKGIGDHGNGGSGSEGKSEAADVVVAVEKKEDSKNEELKGEERDQSFGKNEEKVFDEKQQERLASVHYSPTKHVVSPKKDNEEAIQSTSSDGISGQSDSNSPRDLSEGKVEGNDAGEGKGKDGEANSNKEKEEGLKVDEGKPEMPADAGEDKTPAAKSENASAASD